MAQYKPDFSAYTTGQAPMGWSSIWHAATLNVTAAGTPWGKSVVLTPTTASRVMATVDEFGTAEDAEILGVFTYEGAQVPNLRLRVQGDDTNESAYYVEYVTASRNFIFYKYINASYKQLGVVYAAGAVLTGKTVYLRFKVTGYTLAAKVWEYGTSEDAVSWKTLDDDNGAGAGIDGTARITGAGGAGVGTYYDPVTIQYLAYGDGGQAAPRYDEEITSNKPAYHDIDATAVASGSPVHMVADPQNVTGSALYSWRANGVEFATSRTATHTPTVNTEYTCVVTDGAGEYGTYTVGSVTVTSDTAIINPLDGGYVYLPDCSVTNSSTATPTVNVKPRTVFKAFHRVDNVNGKTPSFVLSTLAHQTDNFTGNNIFFPSGDTAGYLALMKPIWTTTPDNPASWTEFDNAAVGTDVLNFSNNSAFGVNTIYVDVVPTSRFTYTQNRVQGFAADSRVETRIHATSATVKNEDGKLIPATSRYSFRFGNGGLACVLVTGIHPYEDSGEFAFWGAVDWLLGGSADANDLLSKFTFFCYPCVNFEGKYGAGGRFTYTDLAGSGEDANRDWLARNSDTIADLRAAIVADVGTPDAFIDFHSYPAIGGTGFAYLIDSTVDTTPYTGSTTVNEDYEAALVTQGYTSQNILGPGPISSSPYWLLADENTAKAQMSVTSECYAFPANGNSYTNGKAQGEAFAQALLAAHNAGNFGPSVAAFTVTPASSRRKLSGATVVASAAVEAKAVEAVAVELR